MKNLPECRMFTNLQESKIFTVSGKLVAASKKLQSASRIQEMDMTATAPIWLVKDIILEIEELARICGESLERKDPIK